MRKFTSVLLALVLCAALLCIGAAAAGSEDVIEIDTPEKLAKIGVDKEYPLDGNYILTDDIDLGGEENQWTPIGSDKEHAFTGTFDGNGYTIRELYINSNSEYAGLFGYVGADGTVKNLTVEGVVNRDATGLDYAYTGGIVGYNGGTVEGCTNKCDVTVSANDYAYTGGVASINNGTVSNCRNTGNVTVTGNSKYVCTGGITGRNYGSAIATIPAMSAAKPLRAICPVLTPAVLLAKTTSAPSAIATIPAMSAAKPLQAIYSVLTPAVLLAKTTTAPSATATTPAQLQPSAAAMPEESRGSTDTVLAL